MEKRMEDSLINQYGFDEAYNWKNEAVTWAWDKAQRDVSRKPLCHYGDTSLIRVKEIFKSNRSGDDRQKKTCCEN